VHPDILAQQAGAFFIVVTFDLPTVGQRKLMKHTINNALTPVLRMATPVYDLIGLKSKHAFRFRWIGIHDPL